MPTADEFLEPPAEGQRRWDDTFGQLRDPQIMAGLEQAQQAIDHAYIDFLEAHEGGTEAHCDEHDCDYEATIAVFCRHTSPQILVGILCGAHHQLLVGRRRSWCAFCRHTGKPVDVWRFAVIFTGSGRPHE